MNYSKFQTNHWTYRFHSNICRFFW